MDIAKRLNRRRSTRTWIHHLGHAATAIVVRDIVLAAGAGQLAATLAGAIGIMAVLEIRDFVDHGWNMDSASDMVTYQPVWVLWALAVHGVLPAVIVGVCVAMLYLLTLRWSTD